MGRCIHTVLVITLGIIFFSSFNARASYTHLLWEHEINKSLNDRDKYYRHVGVQFDQTTFNLLWTPKASLALQEQLKFQEDHFNPWFHFLTGIVNSRSSVEEAKNSFSNAVKCAHDNPGILWVLFLEFQRAKQTKWADNCLKLLEKHFYTSGAQSSMVVSQQLLSFAQSEHKKGNMEGAQRLFNWASRFEAYPFWPTFVKGWVRILQNPLEFLQACSNCLQMIGSSWLLQITLAYYIYQCFVFALFFFILVSLFIIAVEAFPQVFHSVSCLFPIIVPVRLRYAFCIIIYCSFLIFGIIPFLFLTIICLWAYVKKGKKRFLTVLTWLLLLSPVNARIQEMFRVSMSPNSNLGVFRRVMAEGYHIGLEKKVISNLNLHHNDFLAHTANAVVNMKNNKIPAAMNHIRKAEKLNPEDPVVLVIAGNIYVLCGKSAKAEYYYQECLKKYPDNEYALFNLGQLQLTLMNTPVGTAHISQAAEINPRMVNKFIERNSYYFSDTWPSLRQFLQPSYRPFYFWRHIFWDNCGSWKTAKNMWGPSFFGISPQFFLLLAAITLIIFSSIRISNPFAKRSFCKLCGVPICRKCRIGPLCSRCVHETQAIHNESLSKRIKSRIVRNERLIKIFTKIIISFFYPGAHRFYNVDKIVFVGIIQTIFTSAVYAGYMAIFLFDFSYPFWVVKDCFHLVFWSLIIFNVYFAYKAVLSAVVEIKKIRSQNGTQR